MTKVKCALFCIEALKKEYPDAGCSLNYDTPLQLLIATRLSAQCTDARVNTITPELFARYPTLEDFMEADITDIERIIYPCGFYRVKARDIKEMCRQLYENFNGELPDTIEELTTLAGVGRKTANLIVGDVFGKPAVVADTHCIRVTNRLGLCNSTNPAIVERQLRKVLPPEESSKFCHAIVLHGRAVCSARKPKCEKCVLAEYCKSRK